MSRSGPTRRTLAGCAAPFVLLAGGLTGLATAGNAASLSKALPASVAHGPNFLIESALDYSFCVDEAPGTAPGRIVSLSPCSTALTERWTLTENADGTNAIVDSQGMCLDTTGRKAGDQTALEVLPCNFKGHERFSFSGEGQFQAATPSNACPWEPNLGGGVATSLARCDSTSTNQVFKLAH